MQAANSGAFDSGAFAPRAGMKFHPDFSFEQELSQQLTGSKPLIRRLFELYENQVETKFTPNWVKDPD
jgi:hypothetical protein